MIKILWKLMYATWKSKWKYFLHTKETRSKLLAVNSCKSSTVRNQKSLFAQGWHARSFSIFNIIIFHKKTSISIFNIKLFEIVISIFSMKPSILQSNIQYIQNCNSSVSPFNLCSPCCCEIVYICISLLR